MPSILRRVAWSLLLCTLLGATVAPAVIWYVGAHEADELGDHTLRESAELLLGPVDLLHREGRHPEPAPAHTEYEEQLVWQVIEYPSNRVTMQSHKAPARALPVDPTGEPYFTPDGLWRAVSLRLPTGPSHYLVVAQSAAERSEVRDETIVYTALAAVGMGLGVTLLLGLLVSRELKPLSRLSERVGKYDPLNPESAPLPLERAELAPMAEAIRVLGERLARRILNERAFTAHAAHAFRTPLAGIDAQLAVAIKEAPESLRPRLLQARLAAARLNRVIQALLTLFRSDRDPIRQALQVSDLVGPMTFGNLEIDFAQDDNVDADPDLLAAALLNLLDNAQRYQARRVRVEAGTLAGRCHVCLHDDGPGCPPERLAALSRTLARHARDPTGPALDGVGMGLALADLVMRAHGGELRLSPTERGFRVELDWVSTASP